MKVLVCGGRDYPHKEAVDRILGELRAKRGDFTVIEGGQTGADRWAQLWAKRNGAKLVTEEADWDNITAPGAVVRSRRDGSLYNAAAGPARNMRMLKHEPDLVLAFPGGRGTESMCKLAIKAGVSICQPMLEKLP